MEPAVAWGHGRQHLGQLFIRTLPQADPQLCLQLPPQVAWMSLWHSCINARALHRIGPLIVELVELSLMIPMSNIHWIAPLVCSCGAIYEPYTQGSQWFKSHLCGQFIIGGLWQTTIPNNLASTFNMEARNFTNFPSCCQEVWEKVSIVCFMLKNATSMLEMLSLLQSCSIIFKGKGSDGGDTWCLFHG